MTMRIGWFSSLNDPRTRIHLGFGALSVVLLLALLLSSIVPQQPAPYTLDERIPISSTMEAKVTGPINRNYGGAWVVPVTVTAQLPGTELISVQQKRNSAGDQLINAWTVTVKTRAGGSTFDVDDFEKKFPWVDSYKKFQVKIDWVLAGE